MLTSNNFNSLSFINPFRERVKTALTAEYGSLRNLSLVIGVSPAAVTLWLTDYGRYPNVHKKIITELGFDPFRYRDNTDNVRQEQTRDFVEN